MRNAVAILLALTTAIGCRTDTMRRSEPTRTLESVLPHLTRDLTLAKARDRLGAPDEETGSGLIIYKYLLTEDRTLMLGFPGFAPISYAQIEGKDGARRALELR